MKKSNAIKLIMFFLLLVLIPSVFAECLNSQGWVDLARKTLEKEFKEKGIDRKATDAEISFALSQSVSKIGRFEPAKSNEYLRTKSKEEIGQVLSEMNDPVKRKALEQAVETSTPTETNQIIGNNFKKVTSKKFEKVLFGESMGGNAGLGHAAVNFVIDRFGNIVEIGNIQNLAPEVRAKRESGEYFDAGFRIKVSKSEGKNYEAYYEETLTTKQKEIMQALETELNTRGKDYSGLLGGLVEPIQPVQQITISEAKLKNLLSKRSEYQKGEGNIFALEKSSRVQPSSEDVKRINSQIENGINTKLYRGLQLSINEIPEFLSNLERNGFQSRAAQKGKSIKDLSPEQLEQYLKGQIGGSSDYIQSFTTKLDTAKYFAGVRIGLGKLPVVIEINTLGFEKSLDARHFGRKIEGYYYEHEVMVKSDIVPFENIQSIMIAGETIYEKPAPGRVSEKVRLGIDQQIAQREVELQKQGVPYTPEKYVSGPEALPPEVRVIEGAEKVGAMGDVHANYEATRRAVENAGFIDSNGKWIAGKAVFVFTGDIVDAGPNAKGVIDFIRNLQLQAKAAGGKVEVLRGNHDQMVLDSKNAKGDMAKVGESNNEYYDPVSRRYLTTASGWWWQGGRETAVSFLEGAGIKTAGKTNKQLFDAFKEYTNTAEGKDYMNWLDSLPYVARVNNIIFVHGAPDFSARNIQEVGQSPDAKLNLMWGRKWFNNDAAIAKFKRDMGVGEDGVIVFGHDPNFNNPRGGYIFPEKGIFGINFVPREAGPRDAEGVLVFDKRGVKLKFGDQSQSKPYGDANFKKYGQKQLKELEKKAAGQTVVATPLPLKAYVAPSKKGVVKASDITVAVEKTRSFEELKSVLKKIVSLQGTRGRIYLTKDIVALLDSLEFRAKAKGLIDLNELGPIPGAGGINQKVQQFLSKEGAILINPKI